MDNTVCENCPYVKMGLCSTSSECPNYLESWWTQGQETQPKLVKDCAPKRMLLQQQYLQLRVEQQQAAIDAARAEYLKLTQHMAQVLDFTKVVLESHAENLKLQETKTLQIESTS